MSLDSDPYIDDEELMEYLLDNIDQVIEDDRKLVEAAPVIRQAPTQARHVPVKPNNFDPRPIVEMVLKSNTDKWGKCQKLLGNDKVKVELVKKSLLTVAEVLTEYANKL